MSDNKKESVALSSVFASAGMTVMKLVVGMLTGSMGIISEAAHSALDLGAALLTFFTVRVSDKPADKEHPYGHGKLEAVSALIETGLLFLTSAWIIYEAISRILEKNIEIEVTWYAFVVIILSIIIDFSRSRALSKVAKETNSQALEADALHFSSDIWSSCVVLLGLILVSLGIKGADAFAAIGVSVFVSVAGYRLGKRTIDVLIDTAPEGIADIVKDSVENVEGVIRVGNIRARPLGTSVSIELEISINRSFSVVKVDDIVNKTKEAIKMKIPEADVVVYTKSIHLKDETMIDVVKTLSAKHVASVHNIIIDNLNGKKFISYDLELPNTLTVAKAHEIASHIEDEIQSEIGNEVEILTHIQPQITEEIASDELSSEEIKNLEEKIRTLAESQVNLNEPHDILIRKIQNKIFITLHCYTDGNKILKDSYESVRMLKSLIKETSPSIRDVVIHVEPE